MEYRSVGRSGLRVSIAGLGCNAFGARLDESSSREVLWAALDAGINFFDTARLYGDGRSEEFMGRALKSHRDEIVLATKFGYSTAPSDAGGSRRHLLASVDASLTALETDRVDLLQLHMPDPLTPLEETLRALTSLVQQGKVRYIGCSNFAGWQVADANWIAATNGLEPFVSVQNRWNVLDRTVEQEVKPACERFGCAILPFHPLGSGLLTGKVSRGERPREGTKLADPYHAPTLTDENFDKIDRLKDWGARRGRSLIDIALSWLASQPVVASVIAGATSADQLRANVAATQADLTAIDVAEIDGLIGV